MDETGIKDERLQLLMKAALNTGGKFEADMLKALEKATTEHEFEVRWYREIRNELNRVCSFYNELAKRLGGEKIQFFT
jgi:hypothetical protein